MRSMVCLLMGGGGGGEGGRDLGRVEKERVCAIERLPLQSGPRTLFAVENIRTRSRVFRIRINVVSFVVVGYDNCVDEKVAGNI